MDTEPSAIKAFRQSIAPLSGNYTEKQFQVLTEYMHANFPHWEAGGGRHKSLLVEYPPSSICSQEEWKDSLDKVLLPEWEGLHPALKRQNIIVRYAPKLKDYKRGIEVGGHGQGVSTPTGQEQWIRIGLINTGGSLLSEQDLLFIIVHEIAETDFWIKTHASEKESLQKEADLVEDLLRYDRSFDYQNLTDEKIANLRAQRALQRKWPNPQLSFPLLVE